MTAHVRRPRGSSVEINRVAKISPYDLIDTEPDVLCELKRAVDNMDALEASDNPQWVARVAALPSKYQTMFALGQYDRLRYRHYIYGQDRLAQQDALGAVLSVSTLVSKWYRLQSSTPNAGEWDSIVETIGGSPIVQPGAIRKPAVGTSVNGFPVAIYDGTDVMLQPLEAGNNGTTSWWLLMRVKPADFGASQALHDIVPPDASARRSKLMLSGGTGRVLLDLFVSGFNGRRYETAGSLTVGVASSIYVEWLSSRANECDLTGSDTNARLRIFIGTTPQAITPSDNGTGGVPTDLLAATGNACIGGSGNSDTPATPLRNGGQVGPNIHNGTVPLSPAALAALVNFEAFT